MVAGGVEIAAGCAGVLGVVEGCGRPRAVVGALYGLCRPRTSAAGGCEGLC